MDCGRWMGVSHANVFSPLFVNLLHVAHSFLGDTLAGMLSLLSFFYCLGNCIYSMLLCWQFHRDSLTSAAGKENGA